VSTSASVVQVSVTSPVEQNVRAAAPESTKDGSTILLIPSPDSPLIKRNWIRKESLCDDDNCSSAVEKLENALKEVKECISRKDQAAAEYQEKITNASERERDLQQCYEQQISHLEEDVAKLEMEKKEENTTHETELKTLQQQHTEETKDLQYTIQVQAKHCRELDTKLEKFKSDYAQKEQDVAQLREKLKIRENELQELDRKIKDLQEEKDFEIEKKLTSMLTEKEEIEKKLKTCKGISELVSQLPNVTNQDKRDEITQQAMSKLREISRTPSAKKAISWR
jgi:chromosome segregation ATPase